MAKYFKNGLTAEKLRQILDYDPATGIFRWRIKFARNIRRGDIAGSLRKSGYRIISIKGVHWFEHRLAFLYVTGRWPAEEIDHVDRNRANNVFSNLREASRSQNCVNWARKNKFSLQGVNRVKRGRGYVASITKGGIRYYLGTHDTPEAAHAAYLNKAKELHGQFVPQQLEGI